MILIHFDVGHTSVFVAEVRNSGFQSCREALDLLQG